MGTSEILADCLAKIQSTNSVHLSRLVLDIRSSPEQLAPFQRSCSGGASDTWMGHVLVCHNDCMSQCLFSLPFVCSFPDRSLPFVPSFCACPTSPTTMPFVFPSLFPFAFSLRSAAIICHVTQTSTSTANDLPVQQRRCPDFPYPTLTSNVEIPLLIFDNFVVCFCLPSRSLWHASHVPQ